MKTSISEANIIFTDYRSHHDRAFAQIKSEFGYNQLEKM